MGWTDDLGLNNPWEAVANGASGGLYGLGKAAVTRGPGLISDAATSPDAQLERDRKRLLMEQAQRAGGFADWGQQGYQNNFGNYYGQLQGLANGQNSLAAEQLRQGMGQQLAAQRAAAASGNPNNAAMNARTAMNNMARAQYGMAGQAATAGIQERNAALAQMGQALGQQANVGMQGRQTAMNGYGAGMVGAPEKSWIEKYGPMIIGGAQEAAKAVA